MIKIDKNPNVPNTLKGAVTPHSINDVDRNIYAAPDVTKTLLDDQHNKCAYCEIYMEGPYSDVEHFRPKASYRANVGSPRIAPGYHFLAHTWSNLLYACNQCNRSLKNDIFPLVDECKRGNITKDISHEMPLIINPATDNPSDYIVYNRHMPHPVVKDGVEDAKGRLTIDLFQLCDRHIVQRRELWDDYANKQYDIEIMNILLSSEQLSTEDRTQLEKLKKSIQEQIKKIVHPSRPFSGMFVSNIAI